MALVITDIFFTLGQKCILALILPAKMNIKIKILFSYNNWSFEKALPGW